MTELDLAHRLRQIAARVEAGTVTAADARFLERAAELVYQAHGKQSLRSPGRAIEVDTRSNG